MEKVLPYTTQGEEFEGPRCKPVGVWCTRTGSAFVYRWTKDAGWEFAPTSELQKKKEKVKFSALVSFILSQRYISISLGFFMLDSLLSNKNKAHILSKRIRTIQNS